MTRHSDKLNILHIAPFNVANVPFTFMRAERESGHRSRLITFGRNARDFPEDICLELPWLNPPLLNWLRSKFSGRKVSHIARIPSQIPLHWTAGSPAERLLFGIREFLWKNKIQKAYDDYQFESFDVIQLDGGLDFYRDGRLIRRLKDQGKCIICCYTGSDLRVRGVIPQIDAIADVNITVEFDHLRFHPNIHHVFFPFDRRGFKPKQTTRPGRLKIGHAPTNRLAKGSDVIIDIVRGLEREYAVELVLIENVSYDQAIRMKSECDIFIDQIGDLGYGMNSLEALAMGIPTCTCLAPGFAEKYPDHPFVVIDSANLRERLVELIRDDALREGLAARGGGWLIEHHDACKIVGQIHRLAGLY